MAIVETAGGGESNELLRSYEIREDGRSGMQLAEIYWGA